jgi:hypothetical protein
VPCRSHRRERITHCSRHVPIAKTQPCAESGNSYQLRNRTAMRRIGERAVLITHSPVASLANSSMVEFDKRPRVPTGRWQSGKVHTALTQSEAADKLVVSLLR